MKISWYSLANESDLPAYEWEAVGLGNAVEIGSDGWALVPFGAWPHPDGLQQFGRDEAGSIVGYFKNTWNRIKRAVTGLPIFRGHPDLPGALGNEYTDKREYGQIADMEVRPDGLALKLVLSEAGAALVEHGAKYISPHWLANAIGKTGAGQTIFAPVFLKSVGLTARPNIPCPSLCNSAAAAAQQTKQEKTTMPKWLIELLGLANEATEEQAKAAVTALKTRPEATALANEQTARTAAEGKATALEATVTALTNEKKAVETKLTETQTALANERKERVDGLLVAAVRAGRILDAERETWRGRLLANFPAESVALANAVPKVKTASEIPTMLAELQHQMEATLGNAGGGGKEPDGDEAKGSKIKAAVEKEMAKLGNIKNAHARYNTAFANVKRANPKWFAQAAASE